MIGRLTTWYRSVSIRYRVALAVFIGGALIVVVVVQQAVRSTEQRLWEQFDERAEIILDVLTAISREPLLTLEYSQHTELLSDLRGPDSGRTIDLLDIDGHVVASSAPERVGLDATESSATISAGRDSRVVERRVRVASGDIGVVRIALDRSTVEQVLAVERRQGVYAGLVGLVGVALIALLGGWGFTRRLASIETGLGEIDEDGLPLRVDERGNDEISRLGSALNQRTEQIRKVLRANEETRAQLQLSETKLRLALTAAADAVVEFDVAAGLFSVVGSSAIGSQLSAAAGASTDALARLIHPDDQRLVAAAVERQVAGEPQPTEAEIRVRGAGDEWRTVLLRFQTALDEDGELARVLIAMLDVSAQRELERHVIHADKMQTIGRLTAGIAHDFNNVLAVSRLLLSILARPDRDRTKDDEHIAGLLRANDQAMETVSRLLDSSGPQLAAPTVVDVNRLITLDRGLLEPLLGGGVAVELELLADPSRVLIDQSRFRQVILNLARNAADAMAGNGSVAIRTSNADPERVTISITDTGPGVETAVTASMFEPFVTTKPAGAGTGLGLAIAYETVTNAGGRIEAENRPDGGGAVFTITLPVSPPDAATPADLPSAPGTGEHQRILVVDDNQEFLSSVVHTLRDHGYTVVGAEAPATALELIRVDEAFELLLTDIDLPQMSGIDLARTIEQERPAMAVLFMSALPRSDEWSDAVFVRVVQKPFTDATLLARVAAALASRRDRSGRQEAS